MSGISQMLAAHRQHRQHRLPDTQQNAALVSEFAAAAASAQAGPCRVTSAIDIINMMIHCSLKRWVFRALGCDGSSFVLPYASCVIMCIALISCGGGDSGGKGSAGAGANSPVSSYPILTQGTGFALPALTEPSSRPVVGALHQQGRVVLPAGAPTAGLTVEWLDASAPETPVVVATSTTLADGSFRLDGDAGPVAIVDQWVRVRTGDGQLLRGYATGWVELSPGTEAAVREITRLRKAGAFTAHTLTAKELSGAQESLTLLWLGVTTNASATVEADDVVRRIRFAPAWNDMLQQISLSTPAQGAGDSSGLMPAMPSEASWPSAVTINGAQSTATFTSSCFATSIAGEIQCPVSSVDAQTLGDNFVVDLAGVKSFLSGDTTPFGEVINAIHELPLIEFPYVPGTKVLFDQAQLDLVFNPTFRASAKVTRRTYAAAPVDSLGGSVQAVLVVVDYEIALLDKATGTQSDYLRREKRWFSPAHGRVRVEQETFKRSGPQTSVTAAAVNHSQATMTANRVSGTFIAGTSIPYAGVADVVAIGLRHRHAVYSAVLNRVYVAVPDSGGQILELDGDTLSKLRSFDTSSVPGRLAISSDGDLLYAGLDGGHLGAWHVADLSPVFDTLVPTDEYGQRYPKIFDISIDPFDKTRVVILAGGLVFGNSGPLLVYKHGALVLKDAPTAGTNFGWDFYSPNAVAWTSVRDQYLAASLGSPMSLFRFEADEASGNTVQLSSLLRVDDVDWHDVGGSVLTPAGQSLDAVTFAQQFRLSLNSLPLTRCHRQSGNTDVCELQIGSTFPNLVELEHSTGEFLGNYVPHFDTFPNGCDASASTDPTYTSNYAGLTFAPISAGRNLVSSAEAAEGNGDVDRCSLQLWKLHGVTQ